MVAIIRAASFASVPLFVKKTLASGIGSSEAIRSASSTIGLIRYNVDVCSIRAACAWTASTTSGMA